MRNILVSPLTSCGSLNELFSSVLTLRLDFLICKTGIIVVVVGINKLHAKASTVSDNVVRTECQ